MPGRLYNSANYRYGFNSGGEKDDEIIGVGNLNTTFYRELDLRLGRWWAIDPKIEYSESPYASMRNTPIQTNDPKGDWPPFISPPSVWSAKAIIYISKAASLIDNAMKHNPIGILIDNKLKGNVEDKKPMQTNLVGEMEMNEGDNQIVHFKGAVTRISSGGLPGATLGGAGAKAIKFRYSPSPLRKVINDVAKGSDALSINDNAIQTAKSTTDLTNETIKATSTTKQITDDSIIVENTSHLTNGDVTTFMKAKNSLEASKGIGRVIEKPKK
ncbi:MAG: hypothetical protein ACK50A_01775 [Sphingobacteriaceae bacterium]